MIQASVKGLELARGLTYGLVISGTVWTAAALLVLH
jgi:hypothetical protein